MNWRQQIQLNQRKTYALIVSFLCLYVLLGVLVLWMLNPYLSLRGLWSVLQEPSSQYFISIFMGIAIVITLVGVLFGGRLSLSGTDAYQLRGDESEIELKALYNIVEEMKIASGLNYMPKVYVMNVGYLNAFAAGWNEKNALIAVTRPLIRALNRDELQAVVAHEMSHIKHYDIRVMTLLSVMSGLIVMGLDVLFHAVRPGRHQRRSKKQDASGLLVVVIILARMIIPLITALMVLYVSRKRELMADAGCVALTRDNQALAKALVKIHKRHTHHQDAAKEAYAATKNEGMRSLAYIYSPKASNIKNIWNMNDWFSTHPSLEQRLEALGVSKDDL